MSTTHDRAVSVAAAMSSAGQSGFAVQRRQLALERYVAAIAGDRPAHLRGTASGSLHGRDNAAEHTVAGVMSGAVSLPTTAAFADVLRALAAHSVTAIPVTDRHRVAVGVVSEADLLLHVVGDAGRAQTRPGRAPRATRNRSSADLTAGDLMSSPAVTTTPEASITQAATIAAQAHVKVLPVVDPAGRVVGMLTRADLLGAYLQEAE